MPFTHMLPTKWTKQLKPNATSIPAVPGSLAGQSVLSPLSRNEATVMDKMKKKDPPHDERVRR